MTPPQFYFFFDGHVPACAKKGAKRISRHLALAGGAAIVRREWTLRADHKPLRAARM